jgi:hypothetical protein
LFEDLPGATLGAVVIAALVELVDIQALANVDAVRAGFRADAARPGTHAVVIDAESIAFVDVTAVRMLLELAATGVRLARAHGVGQVPDLLDRGQHTAAALLVYPERGGGRRRPAAVMSAVPQASPVPRGEGPHRYDARALALHLRAEREDHPWPDPIPTSAGRNPLCGPSAACCSRPP